MLRMNIWGIDMEMLMLGMLGSFDRCNVGWMWEWENVMSECENVRSECFDRCNVRSECFDKCNLMLRMNISGMDMEMLMLRMLGSFDRWNVRGECRNRGMLGMNVVMLGVNALITVIEC